MKKDHFKEVLAEFQHYDLEVRGPEVREPSPHILAIMLIAEIRTLKEAINNIDNITVHNAS